MFARLLCSPIRGASAHRPAATAGVAALLTLLGSADALRAQPADRAFDDEVTVLEVEVPVRVLRGGVGVPGLGRDDFVLLDRGEPQEIVGFEVLDIREERLAAQADDSAAERGGTRATRRPDRRNVLLVFDLNQLSAVAFLRARPRLDAWLDQPFAPVDRFAVGLFGSADLRTPRDKSIRLVTPFTGDREQLRLAIDVVAAVYDRKPKKVENALAVLRRHEARPASQAELRATVREIGLPVALSLLAVPRGETSSYGRLGDPKDTRKIPEPEAFAAVPDGRGIFGDADFRISAGTEESRLRWLALAMAEVVTLLADLEGQNHVVLVSEPGYPSVEDSNTVGRLEPMHNAFRRSGWTFHAIDSSGVGFRGTTLFYMANETGGELLENQLEIDGALERLLNRTDLTYRLRFRPSELGEPGSYHRLSVRLAKDLAGQVEIQHRAGYYAPRPDASAVREEDWFTLDRALRDGRVINPGAIALGAPTPDGDRVAVPVAVDAAMLLGPRDRDADHRADHLTLRALAVRADGSVKARTESRLPIGAGPDGQPAVETSTLSLDLDAESYRLRVLVQEPESGAVALTTLHIDLGSGGKKKR